MLSFRIIFRHVDKGSEAQGDTDAAVDPQGQEESRLESTTQDPDRKGGDGVAGGSTATQRGSSRTAMETLCGTTLHYNWVISQGRTALQPLCRAATIPVDSFRLVGGSVRQTKCLMGMNTYLGTCPAIRM